MRGVHGLQLGPGQSGCTLGMWVGEEGLGAWRGRLRGGPQVHTEKGLVSWTLKINCGFGSQG